MVSTRRQIERQQRQDEIKDLKDVKTPPDVKRRGKKKAASTLHKQATLTAATAAASTQAATQETPKINGGHLQQQRDEPKPDPNGQAKEQPNAEHNNETPETQDTMDQGRSLEEQVRRLQNDKVSEGPTDAGPGRSSAEHATQTTPAGGLLGRLRAGFGSIFSPLRTTAQARTDGSPLAPSVKRRLSTSGEPVHDSRHKRARYLDSTDASSPSHRAMQLSQSAAPTVRFSDQLQNTANAPQPHTPAPSSLAMHPNAPNPSYSVPASKMVFPKRKRGRIRSEMEEELRNESARKQGFLPPMTNAQIRRRARLERDYAVIELKYPSYRARPEFSTFRQLTTRGDLTEDNIRNRSAPLPGGPSSVALGKRKMPDTPAEDLETPAPKRAARDTSASEAKPASNQSSPLKDTSDSDSLFGSGGETTQQTPKLPFTPNPTGTYACPLFSDSSDEEEDEVKTPTGSQPIPTPTPASQNVQPAGTPVGGSSIFATSTPATDKPVAAPIFSFQTATSGPTAANGKPASTPLFSPHKEAAALTPITEESSSMLLSSTQKAASAAVPAPRQPSFVPPSANPPSTSAQSLFAPATAGTPSAGRSAGSIVTPHSADLAPSAPNHTLSSDHTSTPKVLFSNPSPSGLTPSAPSTSVKAQESSVAAPAPAVRPADEKAPQDPEGDFPKEYFATHDEWETWFNDTTTQTLKDADASLLSDPGMIVEALTELRNMARNSESLDELLAIGEGVGIDVENLTG